MDELLRSGLRIGVLVLGLSLLMLPFQPRDSAEFVVTVLAALVGGAFVLAVALLIRRANPQPPQRLDAREKRNPYNKRDTGRE
jgi:hypothetical protein